ncbi:hypothetical protein OIU77_008173 [Salix suchowensis]|uniref:RNA helicase n=1 Tax=Salix suchowensis TaxID=1278906 RepID=A0ABQ9AIQ7_9ROSI|nr:hypothetical protein OIU77_008173 [Salix suchowensis]
MSLRPSSTKTAKSLHSHYKTKTTLKPSLFFLSSLVSIRNHQTLSFTNQPLPRPLRFRHHGILSVKCFGVADSHSKKLALPYTRSMQSFNYGRFAYRDVSSDESDYELGSSQKEMTGSTLDNADDWKWKLTKLLQSKDQQEVVSRERKDRRDFEHLSAMATRMGLHSRQYSRIVVFSKVPLPNYRPDLDDKRPQRESNELIYSELSVRNLLSNTLLIRSSPRAEDFFPPNSLSRSNNGGSMETGERIYARPELSVQNSVSMERILSRKSLQLRNQQEEWQESPEGQKMIEFRRSLPAYKEKDLLLKAISENQVIVVSGETGCGKTTQLPQYILEYEIEAARGAACSIICTQPRRISAMSVSERVAAERGEKLGESVGYKVRLEGMRGRDTRLLFCTTGILLRRLLLDRDLKGVTHVIVDEIHERGMNEDFLLIVLRDLLPRRPELRLILMSATVNADLFSSYFGGAPAIHIPVEDCPSLEFLSLLFSFASVHSLFVLLPPLFFVQSIGIPLCMLLSRDS